MSDQPGAWLVIMSRYGTRQLARYLHKAVLEHDRDNALIDYIAVLDEAFIWTTRREDAAEFNDEALPVAICFVLQDRLDGDSLPKIGYTGRFTCRPVLDTDEWRSQMNRAVLR